MCEAFSFRGGGTPDRPEKTSEKGESDGGREIPEAVADAVRQRLPLEFRQVVDRFNEAYGCAF